MKNILIIAASSAFLSVALGVIGSHAFKRILLETGKATQFQTATEYQWYHTIGLFLMVWLFKLTDNPLFISSAWVMLVGMVLFSGSLYLYSLTSIKVFAHVTPVGGLSFLVAWGLALYGLVKSDF